MGSASMDGILPAAATPCTSTIPISPAPPYGPGYQDVPYVETAAPHEYATRSWLTAPFLCTWNVECRCGSDEIAGREGHVRSRVYIPHHPAVGLEQISCRARTGGVAHTWRPGRGLTRTRGGGAPERPSPGRARVRFRPTSWRPDGGWPVGDRHARAGVSGSWIRRISQDCGLGCGVLPHVVLGHRPTATLHVASRTMTDFIVETC